MSEGLAPILRLSDETFNLRNQVIKECVALAIANCPPKDPMLSHFMQIGSLQAEDWLC